MIYLFSNWWIAHQLVWDCLYCDRAPPTVLFYPLVVAYSLPLGVGYIFLIGSSLFLDGCSAVSCNFGILVRGSKPKFYSAIFSQSPILYTLNHL